MSPTNLKAGGASGIDFDYVSSVYNVIGDSIPLFMRKGDGGLAGWKWILYDDNKFTNQQIA